MCSKFGTLYIFRNFADMSKYTEHFMDELKQIAEILNTTPEKVESIGAFVACAKFEYDFIKYIICNIKETWVMDKAIQVIIDTWNEYLNKHDDICYNISYTEDYSLETGGISRVKQPMMKIPKFLDIERSLNEIKESELNRREVNETYEKGLRQIKNEKTFESDFDHLKNWKDNPNLDYYMSNKHWNYHVNQLLYTYLKVRYSGNEVGVYINLALLNGLDSTKQDYNQIYGVMFNEAYRFCSYVLNTPVPETKIKKMEKEAAGLCHVELAAPIISYNILVMTGLLLSYANDRKDAVGRFLNYLSIHNSSHFFGDRFHHFEDYIKIGLEGVAAIMIDSRLQPPGKLRPGYDYKTQDEYLRKTIPCYRASAEKLEKRVEEASKKKGTQPKDVMGVSSEKRSNGRRRGQGKQLKGISHPPKHMTLKYVTHGAHKELVKRQRNRVKLLFEKWKTPEVKMSDGGWGWLDASIASKDFCDLFEGKDRCCNLKVNRGKPNVVTVFFTRLLKYIPEGKEETLIEGQTKQSAPQIMLEQFGVNAINNLKRLSPTDIKRIKESIYILDWNAPLPLMPDGGDTDYDLRDETLQLYSANIDLGIEQDADVEQAVKSGVLRKGKHT